MAVVTRLAKRRMELGLTQVQVANKAGIQLPTYQKLESGVNNIKKAQAYTVVKIAEAVGLSVLDLIKD